MRKTCCRLVDVSCRGACYVAGLGQHLANAGARRQWPAVVRPDIGLTPAACSATTTALSFSERLGGFEAINLQGRFMVTGPIAFTLAPTIDEQLANSMSAN